MKTADVNAARELVLYAENTFTVYNSSILPTVRSLAKKWKKGAYDPQLACKAWGYVVEASAKQYAREFAASGRDWCRLFDAATRRAAAAELETNNRDFVRECAEGVY